MSVFKKWWFWLVVVIAGAVAYLLVKAKKKEKPAEKTDGTAQANNSADSIKAASTDLGTKTVTMTPLVTEALTVTKKPVTADVFSVLSNG